MKKAMNALIGIALACFLGGFYLIALDNYSLILGLIIMATGWIFALSAAIPAAKLIQQQNKQTEDRIKILEEEIEMLKQNGRHK